MTHGNERYYPVMDNPTREELKVLGFCKGFIVTIAMSSPFVPGKVGLVGVKTNEYRRPRAGEWFLSGYTPEVFKASRDYVYEYDIMRLVVIETNLRTTEVSFHRAKQLTES